MTLFFSGAMAGLLWTALNFGMSVRKRRRDPFKSIKKFREGRQRRLPSDPAALGMARQEAERRVDFWELENSPFQRHRDLDLSLFRSVPVRDKLNEWSTSVSGTAPPGTGTEKSSGSSSVDRVNSNGDVHDANGVSGEDLWPNPLSLLAEEEISYILVDEEGRPIRNGQPPTQGGSQRSS